MMTWLHSEIPIPINAEVKSNPSAPLGVQLLGFAQNMLVERSRDEKLIYVCVPLGSARGTILGSARGTDSRLRSGCRFSASLINCSSSEAETRNLLYITTTPRLHSGCNNPSGATSNKSPTPAFGHPSI